MSNHNDPLLLLDQIVNNCWEEKLKAVDRFVSSDLDPETIIRLNQLLVSNDPDVRNAVALAIREIKDPLSLPYLLDAINKNQMQVIDQPWYTHLRL